MNLMEHGAEMLKELENQDNVCNIVFFINKQKNKQTNKKLKGSYQEKDGFERSWGMSRD